MNAAALPWMLKMLISVTLLLMMAPANCQPQQPVQFGVNEPNIASHGSSVGHQDGNRYRRHLTAYINTNDDDDDIRWMLIAAAAAAGMTSLIAVFALCTCCYPFSRRYRRDESYIGQIDLEDIRVICNHSVAPPGGVWTTNTDSAVSINARTLELLSEKHHHNADSVVLNNQRVTAAKPGDSKTAVDDTAEDCPTDAGMNSDVLVENGRIVLQYRNIHTAGGRTTDNASTNRQHQALGQHYLQDTVVDRTDMGHVIVAPVQSTTVAGQEYDYDMNDVVWKNLAASSPTKY